MKKQKAMKNAAKVPKVAKATKVAKINKLSPSEKEKEKEKDNNAANYILQLQNTNMKRKNMKDTNYKAALELAGVEDTKKTQQNSVLSLEDEKRYERKRGGSPYSTLCFEQRS